MPAKIIVYDKDGNPGYHTHMCDVKEALRSGNWFLYNPKEKPIENPQIVNNVFIGEDIITKQEEKTVATQMEKEISEIESTERKRKK